MHDEKHVFRPLQDLKSFRKNNNKLFERKQLACWKIKMVSPNFEKQKQVNIWQTSGQ